MKKRYFIYCILVAIIIILLIGIIFLLNERNTNTIESDEANVSTTVNNTSNLLTNELNVTSSNNTTGNEIIETNETSGNTSTQDSEISKSTENVKIEVVEDTISSSGVTIIITDTNEEPYTWGQNYEIQEKVNGNWETLNASTTFNSAAYLLDENNQLEQTINWTQYYGELPEGIYRIVKDADGDTFYSDEFEIK